MKKRVLEEQETDFLFDDFFVALDEDDFGELVEVEIRGRQVPIYIKRGLSLADREAAKSQAIKTRIKPTGEIEIVSMDEAVFAIELMVRCIKSWPFKYSNGLPVEITRENIRAMLADAVDAISLKLISNMQIRQKQREPFLLHSEKI